MEIVQIVISAVTGSVVTAIVLALLQRKWAKKKLDIFFAAGKLTEGEYSELIGMLHPEKTAGEKA